MFDSLSEAPDEFDENHVVNHIRHYSFDHALRISKKNPLTKNKGKIIRETWFKETSFSCKSKLMESQDKMVWKSTRNVISTFNNSKKQIMFKSNKRLLKPIMDNQTNSANSLSKLRMFVKDASHRSKDVDSPAILRMIKNDACKEMQDFSHSQEFPQ